MVDASAMGVGTVLILAYDKGQIQVLSSKSRNFTENGQKNEVIYRNLTAKLYALKIHDFLIIGAKRPLHLLLITNQCLVSLPGKAFLLPGFSDTNLFSHAFENLLFFGHGEENFALC